MIVGIDEVGRGCWAGPLVACAAVLEEEVLGLTDSKMLSAKQREKYFETLMTHSLYGLGWVFPDELDEVGLSEAVRLAMTRAYNKLGVEPKEIIIDGNINYLSEYSMSREVIKADLLHPVVSAASIIAKVSRDRYMYEQAALFPQYGFESHVGYGTKQHIDALNRYGICSLHRKSFKPIRVYL